MRDHMSRISVGQTFLNMRNLPRLSFQIAI